MTGTVQKSADAKKGPAPAVAGLQTLKAKAGLFKKKKKDDEAAAAAMMAAAALEKQADGLKHRLFFLPRFRQF
jgi:hypothetical protein